MQIDRTQQLVKSLALHFVHHKILNISIMQLLCEQQKIHSSTTEEQMQKRITIIDKGFQILKEHKNMKSNKKHKQHNIESIYEKNLYNLVNVFIFNVSAINEHYMNQMEKHMVQSTASQSHQKSMNQTFYKDKLAISILKQLLQSYFNFFTEKSKFLQTTITQIEQSQNKKLKQSQLGFLQTLDYICVKYSIKNQTVKKIVKILQKNEQIVQQNMSQVTNNEFIIHTNKLIFSENKQNELFQLLQTKSHINFKNLFNIIETNYFHQNPPRKIFNSADMSGQQVIQGLIVRILKRINKNELFSQKNEDYTPFRFLLFHFLNKHFSSYLQFSNLIKSLMKQNYGFTSESSIKILKQIEKYFLLLIPIENPQFHKIIQFTYSQLTIKYSEGISLELIKKLVLNRFLLNPSFYVLYNEPNQNQIKNYVQVGNFVRCLFYPQKIDQACEKYKNPHLKKISGQICYSFDYCLKKSKDNQLQTDSHTFLYVNDKILKSHMQLFFEQLNQSQKNPKQAGNLNNIANDYSLSFSLVKNDHHTRNYLASNPTLQNLSQVRFSANTNRSNTNIKDNHSIRQMYNQLNGMKSQKQIPNKSPQKGLKINNQIQNKQEKKRINEDERNFESRNGSDVMRKQHQINNQTRLDSMRLPTDRQIIEELVEVRKQYGDRKKILKLKHQSRRLIRSKRKARLEAFSRNFNQYKTYISHENNLLYINLTTIA